MEGWIVPKISKSFDEAIQSLSWRKMEVPTSIEKNEIRVRVVACALNFFDLLAMVGRYQMKYDPPYR